MIKIVAYFEVPTAFAMNDVAMKAMQDQAVILAGARGYKVGLCTIGPSELDGHSVVVWDLIDVRPPS